MCLFFTGAYRIGGWYVYDSRNSGPGSGPKTARA